MFIQQDNSFVGLRQSLSITHTYNTGASVGRSNNSKWFTLIGQSSNKKLLSRKKWIYYGHVSIPLGWDGSRIIENISGEFWAMVSYQQKSSTFDDQF